MRPTIQNRDFKLPADNWYQIEATGEHPNRAAGLVQVIDNRAIDSIVENFAPGESGILIDAEHFSHDPDKPTTAYGWLMDVQNRDGQLYGKIRWTGTGQPAVEGGDLRFFSTEYGADGCEKLDANKVRPLRLDGLTLTNRPNNKGGKPISNREESLHSSRPAGAPSSANPTEEPSGDGNHAQTNQPKQTQQNKPMTNIAKALGLAEDATEEDILEAITTLKEDKDAGETKADDLEKENTELRNREADGLIKEHTEKIGENKATVDFWRNRLIEDREGTLKVLNDMPVPAKEEQPRMHNRADSSTPDPVGSGEEQEKESKRMELVEEIRNRESVSFDRAWNIARSKNPALFKD